MFSLPDAIPKLKQNPDLVSYKIKSNGKEIDQRLQVISIAVQKELNRIPFVRLALIDGDIAAQTFAISSEDYFVPGAEIEITAGYHSEESLIFKGIVTQHNLRIRANSSRLYVECRDVAFKTTIARKNRFMEETKDSDAIETILNTYNLKNSVATTTVLHQDLVQYEATDWDFVMTRTEANAMVCQVNDGEINIAPPDLQQNAVFDCNYGSNILEFDGEMKAENQYKGTIAKSWNYATQEMTEAVGKEPDFQGTGNLSVKKLAENLEQTDYEITSAGQMKPEELQIWADAELLRSRLSQVVGRVKIQGRSEIIPGMMIKLSGLGERYNGEVYVSGVHHRIADGMWSTDIQFGLPKTTFHETYTLQNTAANGLLPAVNGLVTGVVTQLEEDPEEAGRIKVRLPVIDAEAEGIWCRLSCLDAGNERGTFFRPEVDDEVIVGFIANDPRQGIVLGMLNSSTKPTPEIISKENFKKGYWSREKLKLEFDDEKKAITLSTPAGNSLTLDEDLGGIKIEDQNGNKILLDSDGIAIESAKNISIKTTSGKIEVEGKDIALNAQTGLVAKSNTSSEFSSSGNTVLKGTTVHIN